jgi:hypothetical protein
MGTSTNWRGPRGATWNALRKSLGRLPGSLAALTSRQATIPEDIPPPRHPSSDRLPAQLIEPRAHRFRAALQQELMADPEAYGIRDTALAGGTRLVETLSALIDDRNALGPPPSDWPASPSDWFMTVFVDRVSGDDNTIATGVVRRAATTAAERLISEPGVLTGSAETARSRGLAMDLFCLVYTSFIADVVTEFAKAVIAEQITLAVPGLLLIDPAGRIPDCVGEQVAALIPNPCEQAEAKHGTRRVDEFAMDVLRDNVDRALGISTEEVS